MGGRGRTRYGVGVDGDGLRWNAVGGVRKRSVDRVMLTGEVGCVSPVA